jgi:hypothetical protein
MRLGLGRMGWTNRLTLFRPESMPLWKGDLVHVQANVFLIRKSKRWAFVGGCGPAKSEIPAKNKGACVDCRLIREVEDFEDSTGLVVRLISSSCRETPAMGCAVIIRERVADQEK